ncbi:MAG TPA: rhodanese-like domain-containing protein [Gemmatimonadales bacterium]|nr:rhodanese-like domain-containing protein [Gemmatimonadales bacterium]
MLLQRLYDPRLAQASYLIGCGAAGEAVVIDANRDVDQYLHAAQALGLRIAHVTETHIHADYVSGSRELAARAGATLYLSDEGGPDWRYEFGRAAGAVLLHEGDELVVGSVRLRALHTPGHTPEHLSFLVTDGAAATEPIAAVTGDFVFVGDVGRPDLLERAVHRKGTMEQAARTLFRSLHRFKSQPDYLQIWPGHGAGSACGKGMSAIPHSTVGYERRFNWAFAVEDEDEFVRLVLAGQLEPPAYFGLMKRVNREGPPPLGGLPHPPRLPGSRLRSLLRSGAYVVDIRPAAEFAARHVPGTLNLPLTRSFTLWAGSLLPYDRELYLLTAGPGEAQALEAARDLSLIGLDRVAGSFGPEALDAWTADGGSLGRSESVSAAAAADLASRGATVLDVRSEAEWQAGHIPGARHVPLGFLSERLDELPPGRPLVVHCQGGGRSAIAASLLAASGVAGVVNLEGGFSEWTAAGFPVGRGARSSLADIVTGPASERT